MSNWRQNRKLLYIERNLSATEKNAEKSYSTCLFIWAVDIQNGTIARVGVNKSIIRLVRFFFFGYNMANNLFKGNERGWEKPTGIVARTQTGVLRRKRAVVNFVEVLSRVLVLNRQCFVSIQQQGDGLGCRGRLYKPNRSYFFFPSLPTVS